MRPFHRKPLPFRPEVRRITGEALASFALPPERAPPLPRGKGGERMEKTGFAALSPPDRAELGRRGGLASGRARRRYRLQRDILEELLGLPCPPGEAAEELRAMGVEPVIGSGLAWAVVKKALGGSLDAVKYIREVMGEKGQVSPGNTESVDLRSLSDRELLALARELEEEEHG